MPPHWPTFAAPWHAALGNEEALKDTPRQYLNRLSDLLFVLARLPNRYNPNGSVGDDAY